MFPGGSVGESVISKAADTSPQPKQRAQAAKKQTMKEETQTKR